MLLNTAQGNLVIVDGNKVFWKGQAVPGVVSVKLNYGEGESNVKIKVNGTADALYLELITAGVQIKKEKAK